EAEYVGALAEQDTRVLTLAALKGALAPVVHEPISYVNVAMIARERGLGVSERKSTVSRDYVNLMTFRSDTEAGEVSVAGTLVGKRGGERLVQVFDFDAAMDPARFMACFTHGRLSGAIRTVGTLVGN